MWEDRDAGGGNLYVQQCGYEVCEPGHQYGPSVRDYYLIHFVAEGCGTFFRGERAFDLSAGQGFIIFPGQLTTYRASADTPWTYGWVGYAGYGAQLLTAQVGLSQEQPIFAYPDVQALYGRIRRMTQAASQMRLGELASLGDLYHILALIGQHLQRAEPDIHQAYYQKAVWYMEGNYDRPIRIVDVADFIGLSRSQLFRVFQAVAGTSPKACLQDIRLRQARTLLTGTHLSLEEVAASVGISSPARLGVLFREKYGETMGQYRRRV